jgi:hypothetical protein
VQRITLKALLRPAALERLSPMEHRFCATPACPIVYFGDGGVFDYEDVQVPVFQKSLQGERTVCYCLGISVGLIEREIALGRSTSVDRIRELVKADRCACEIRNPEGSCCLGNVGVVLKAVAALMLPSSERP